MPSGTPTFRSGAAASLWWKATYDGVSHLCTSQGKTVVQDLQDNLAATLGTSPTTPVTSIGGIQIRPAEVLIDGVFGPRSLLAMFAQAMAKGISNAVRDSMIGDWNRNISNPTAASGWVAIRGGDLSFTTVRVIVWLSQHPDLSYDAVDIVTGTVGPQFDMPCPDDGDANGEASCVAIAGPATQGTADDLTAPAVDTSNLRPTTGNQGARGGVPATTPQAGGYPLVAPANNTLATNTSGWGVVGWIAGGAAAAVVAVAAGVRMMRTRGRRPSYARRRRKGRSR